MPVNRNQTLSPAMGGDSAVMDGPVVILMLFGPALLIGVLVGLGARSWGRTDGDRSGAAFGDDRQPRDQPSAEAAQLGYRSERHYTDDVARADTAVQRVLGEAPGTQRLWENAESGNRGMVWASAERTGADGTTCRRLERRTLINDAFRNASAVTCRDAHGAWRAPEWQAE